jgi:hypothetical protein
MESQLRRNKCVTPEMQRLHPDCTMNAIEKERREQKIRNFFQEYKSKVRSMNDPKYKDEYEYQDEYTSFVRPLKENRSKSNERWIYEHYVCDKHDPNCTPHFIENEDRDFQLKTQIQRHRLRYRATLSGIKQQIEEAYQQELGAYSSNPDNAPFLKNIRSLFNETEGIDLENKIEFLYDYLKIKGKIRYIQRFLSKIPIEVFINDGLRNDFLRAEMTFENLFIHHIGPEYFHFLRIMGIINTGLRYEYNLQYTHQFKRAATITLSKVYENYCNRIRLIFKIKATNLKKYITKEILSKTIIREMILKPLEKYLFYTNYGLIHCFERKEEILAVSFEDFYYLHLKQNILFIISFFECFDIPLTKQNIINKGGVGFIYDLKDGYILKVSQIGVSYESSFFEFFKQCCTYKLFPNDTVETIKITFGSTKCYTKMVKINGENYLRYYIKFILHNYKKNIFEQIKYEEDYNFLEKMAKLIKKFKENNYVHRDLNIRNIMIDNRGKYYFIDIDNAIIFINNIFIINYRIKTPLNHIFENINSSITLSLFAKSIDLFRVTTHYVISYHYFKKYENSFKEIIGEDNFIIFKKNPNIFYTNKILLNKILSSFYNIKNNILIKFYEIKPEITESLVEKWFNKAFKLSNIYKFRYDAYSEIFLKRYWRGTKNLFFEENWILPFIPDNFIRLLSQIPQTLPNIYVPPQIGSYNHRISTKLNPSPLPRQTPTKPRGSVGAWRHPLIYQDIGVKRPDINISVPPTIYLPRKGGKKKSPKKKMKTTKKN